MISVFLDRSDTYWTLEISHNENITLNINNLKKARLQNRAFLFLCHSVNNRSKMEQGPAITVPD